MTTCDCVDCLNDPEYACESDCPDRKDTFKEWCRGCREAYEAQKDAEFDAKCARGFA